MKTLREADISGGAASSQHSRHAEFWAGARATLPLVIGSAPFGFIFGAVAVTRGLSPHATQAMSLFVFAGSAQFIAAELVGGGATAAVIILTTFIVNLRHTLYSATLAPHMKHLPQRWLVPLGFSLTDESFVIAMQRYQKTDTSPYKHWYLAGSALFMYTNWQLWTQIGLHAGQSIPPEQVARLGLGFAAVVTFIGMLIPLVRSRAAFIAVCVAGLGSVIFHGLPGHLGLIMAALLGICTGVIAESALKGVSHASHE